MLDRCVGGMPICHRSIASFKTGAITRDIDLLNAEELIKSIYSYINNRFKAKRSYIANA